MDCGTCGHGNRQGARFCGGCGASLAPHCPACRAEAPPGARFCDACGASLAGGPTERAVVRKVVTVVFADLMGSVSLQERLDAESARRVMDRYHRAMTAAVEVHGGRVVQLLGDGVLAAFGLPRVAEDDAIRAVRAAVGMQRAFRELVREHGEALAGVGLRVAVNTGEVVVGDDELSVIGDPTNVAARLQQEARDGDVLLGEDTERLVRGLVTLAPLGRFALRGRVGTVAAHRVVSLDRPARATAAAFVGREAELARLEALFDAAVGAPGPRLGVLLGSPGLGKSRLVAELVRRLGARASVLAARCDAAGGATFAPITEALRAFLRAEDGATDGLRAAIDAIVPGEAAERARIAAGIGALLAGAPAPTEETFFVVRRLLAAVAAVRPVVLVIDDVHWAEPLLLDLVEHLVQWSAGVPLLLLVAARPELRDLRSSLATAGGLVDDVVTLAGLDAGAAMRLAAGVLGAAELPAALVGRVLATSEGNPLFVGELVRMLVQDGTLRREGERWVTTVELAALDMPPTIQVLLAARIERLRPEERAVLERAAVIGRQFSRAALAHLLPREAGDLDARLETLRRSELVEPDSGWLLGEPALRFHHALIRDAAYRRLLKETRAELHERLADWIAGRAGDAVEHDETIGFHLEQAHQNLLELGPPGARGAALGARAARHLGAAGRRALARDDLALAAGLLGRALARLDPQDPGRADLALDWCEALLSAGEVSSARSAVAELAGLAGASDRLRAWHACFAGQLAALTDPQSLRATGEAVAAAAETLAALEDAAGEAKAHSVHALALARLGAVGPAEAALDRALAAARRARDRRRANAVLAGAPLAALWGPSPVTRASGRCLDVVRVLRITQGAPAVESVALRCQAVLEVLRGRGEAARRMLAAARQMVEELGIAHQVLEADVFAGTVALIEGEADAAEGCLRGAYEGLRARGLGIDAARAAALLGRARLAQDDAAEAEALSAESEALAGDDLQAAIAWRCLRAEALAARGEPAEAVALARAAVAIAAETDALLDHADARVALARALHAAGRTAEAQAEEARAHDLWRQKGATLLLERALGEAGVSRAAEATAADRPAVRHPGAHREPRQLQAMRAALDARDLAAVDSLLADDLEVVHHATGSVFGREALLASFRRSFETVEDGRFWGETLATLGELLALQRAGFSSAAASMDPSPVGAVELEWVAVHEFAPSGRLRRLEQFAPDRFGEAIARLYERHAETLPAGPARERAATTARCVGALMRVELEAVGALSTDDCELHDHRRLGFFSGRGREQLEDSVRAQRELVDDLSLPVDELLDLAADAFLVRSRVIGCDRRTGGRIENERLELRCFGPDGRQTRAELFDIDREAEARARFAARAGAPARRVQPNAASAAAERVAEMVAASDAAALEPLFGGVEVFLEHATGASVPGSALIETWGALLRARDPALRQELLATLGGALALLRSSMSFGGLAESDLAAPFGAVERSELVLIEVDGAGRPRRFESFPPDALGAALVRLYERDAELLPEGPECDAAARRARAVAAMLGLAPLEPLEDHFTPAMEFVDHRVLGLPSFRGIEGLRRSLPALEGLADDLAVRVEDLLALDRDAFVLRSTVTGTGREHGGRFERPFLQLRRFGTDGRIARTEFFDTDRAAAALERLDALAAGAAPAPPPVRPNAATAAAEAIVAAFAARDLDAVAARIAEPSETIHHPSGASWGTEGAVASWRMLSEGRDAHYRLDPVATLGPSLALCLQSARASGPALDDPGAYEMDHWVVWETNPAGRMAHAELFAHDRLGDALTRLYERHAEGMAQGPEHWGEAAPEAERARAAVVARAVAGVTATPDPDRLAPLLAPDLAFADRRTLGMGATRGAERYLRGLRSLLDLVTDLRNEDELVAADERALLIRRHGTATLRDGGGAAVHYMLMLWVFGADGRIAHLEMFDPEAERAALARRAELVAGPLAEPFGNAAWRAVLGMNRVWRDRRWEDVVAAFAPDFELVDRRAMTGLDLRGDDFQRGLRLIFDTPGSEWHTELLATRGERHVLVRAFLVAELPERGRVEWEHLDVAEFDAHGRHRSMVLFDPADVASAWAELDARYAAGEGAPHAALLATFAELARAWCARDRAALERVAHESFTATARQRLVGLEETYDRAGWIARCGVLDAMGVEDEAVRVDHLRISPRAALRAGVVCGTRDGGAFEIPLVFVSVHDGTRLLSQELYDDSQAGEALARFDALAAPPSEPLANAATRAAERVAAAWHARDWDAVRAGYAPDARLDDRRSLVGVPLIGEAALANLRLSFDLEDSRWEYEVLATRGDSLALVRERVSGRSDGTPVEFEDLSVFEVDGQGRYAVEVLFDVAAADAAWAELEARFEVGEGAALPPLARPAPAPHPLENTATRRADAFQRLWNAGDWETIEATTPRDLQRIDRRRMLRVDLDRAGHLEWMRMNFALRGSRYERTPIATRGDRLTLDRWRFTAADRDVGPSEVEFLMILSVASAGESAVTVVFDPEDLEAAYAELDARYAAGEAASVARTRAAMGAFSAALARRDWDALAACCAPDLVVADHRRIGWEPLRGPAAYVAALRALVELAPDTRMRLDHVETAEQGFFVRTCWSGTREGGTFEDPSWMVGAIDAQGRMRRLDQYEDEAAGAARTRFAEVAAPAASDPLSRWLRPNAAVAAHDRIVAAFAARDWEGMRAGFAPDARIEQRRAGLRAPAVDPGTDLAVLRDAVEALTDLHTERCLFAVFGERVSIERQTWRGGPAEGRFEVEMLTVIEADAEGRVAAVVTFDPDDVVAAWGEANERWIAQEPRFAPLVRAGLAYGEATRRRNADALRALLADDLVVEDRRRTGFGPLAGADALIESFRAVWQLTQETVSVVRARPAVEPWGSVLLSHVTGTLADGGAFESLNGAIVVFEGGLFRRFEFFEIEHVDDALARFEALRAERERRDPLARWLVPNAAVAAHAELDAASFARDWAAMRARFAPDARIEDRRAGLRTPAIDADTAVAWMRDAAGRDPSMRAEGRLFAVFGDRVSLERQTWRGGAPDGSYEIEMLTLIEADEEGRVAAAVFFDPDDVVGAQREAMRRWTAQRPRNADVLATANTLFDVFNEHDVAGVRRLLADDFVFLDRRRTGSGLLEGVAAYLASLEALLELAPDARLEARVHLAVDAHGTVAIVRTAGTQRDGGDFEQLRCTVAEVADGRLVRLESFEIEHAEAALARLAELRAERTQPDPLRIPENAATRADLRWGALIAARDWDGLRAHFAPELVWEDRRRLFGASGGRDALLANVHLIADARFTVVDRQLLATNGDRLSLTRALFRGGDPGAPAEIETLQLIEVDEGGRIVAVVNFDADDRRGAAVEMLERYVRGEGGRNLPRSQIAFLRAMQTHDLAALRAAIDDDFAFVDHRRTGLGRIDDADDYVASVAALLEQSDDFATDVLYHVAIAEHGSLSVGRTFGTLRDGGPFESVFVRLNRYEGGRNLGTELFELEDLERAKQRFEELGREAAARAGGSGPPPAVRATASPPPAAGRRRRP